MSLEHCGIEFDPFSNCIRQKRTSKIFCSAENLSDFGNRSEFGISTCNIMTAW